MTIAGCAVQKIEIIKKICSRYHLFPYSRMEHYATYTMALLRRAVMMRMTAEYIRPMP